MRRTCPPRHGDRKIEPDGGFAAEEGEGAFERHNAGKKRATSENHQIGLLGYHNDEDKKKSPPDGRGIEKCHIYLVATFKLITKYSSIYQFQ